MGALISFYLYGGFFSNEEKLVGHFALPISIVCTGSFRAYTGSV